MAERKSKIMFWGIKPGAVKFKVKKQERDFKEIPEMYKHYNAHHAWKPKTKAEAEKALEEGKIEKLGWNGLNLGTTSIEGTKDNLEITLQPVRYEYKTAFNELFSKGKVDDSANPLITDSAVVGIVYDGSDQPFFALQVKGAAIGEGQLHTLVAGGMDPNDIKAKDPYKYATAREAREEVGMKMDLEFLLKKYTPNIGHREVGLQDGDIFVESIYPYGTMIENNGHHSIFCIPTLFPKYERSQSAGLLLKRYAEHYLVNPANAGKPEKKREVKGLVFVPATKEGIEGLLNGAEFEYFTPESISEGAPAGTQPFGLRPWSEAFFGYLLELEKKESGAIQNLIDTANAFREPYATPEAKV